jgi:AcrR family transcriptional regulator
LVEDGYGAASTTRIAAAAGVSPGSLYQYFPGKDAIVLAVADRLFERAAEGVMEGFVGSLDSPLAYTVPVVVENLIGALDGQRALVRAVIEEIPSREGLERVAGFERRVTEMGRAYLTAHRGELTHPNLEVATWIIVRAVGQLVLRYILDAPPIPRSQYADEVARLVMSYLGAQSLGPLAKI